MSIIPKLMQLYFAPRIRQIEYFKNHPIEVQRKQYKRLVKAGSKTALGKEFGIVEDLPYSEFRKRVPVMEYPDFERFVERVKAGEKDVIWPRPIGWFAKSSGTTAGKSKYIPITVDGVRRCHMRGPKDVAAIYTNLYPKSKAFVGKTLTLGGSNLLEKDGLYPVGDLSGVLIENTPRIAHRFRVPRKEVALLASFDQKVDLLCKEALQHDVRTFSGVPTWNLIMCERILEHTGKKNMLEVWPNMELFIHGGISFKPYKAQYEKLFPSDEMRYLETYNASEGFFGIAEECYTDEMLLMLDYDCFYEFWPTDHLGNPKYIVPLEEVEIGKNYAVIITSANGLWRYMMGDTIRFTQATPYKFRFTGRTKLFVNAFGEEVIIDNAERAIEAACKATEAEIDEFTMAPVFMGELEGRNQGCHQWVVSFHKAPRDMEQFTDELDKALQTENSDYEIKRKDDFALLRPIVSVVPLGTFEALLRKDGRVGGQIKIPRLNEDRTYVERLVAFAHQQTENQTH